MNIKILIAAHRQCEIPKDEIYLPVHVGKELHPDTTLVGFQSDNEGDNISAKNPYLCELTALYWGWKNLVADYIGLVHYRRYFTFSKKSRCKFANILTSEEATALCQKHDVILPKKRRYYIETLASHYEHTHDIEHLELTREIIRAECPEYLSAYDKVMKRSYAHMFNMCIMKKELLDQYCTWVFSVLSELENKVDVSILSSFNARLFGRVSELLLDVWIEHNQIKYKEIGYVQIGNENWTRKIIVFLAAKFLGRKYNSSK